VLVSAGQSDSRVPWWGPVKFAWRLRQRQRAAHPVLLQWGSGGHFDEGADDRAVQIAFLLAALLPPDQLARA